MLKEPLDVIFDVMGHNAEELDAVTKARWHAAANPRTPPDVLAALAREAAAALLQRIAENPSTPPFLLAELAFNVEAEVRAAVAENQNTPEETLWRLSRDENPDVRYLLAEIYRAPRDLLELLAQDDNPYVAYRARKTLNRLYPDGVLEPRFKRLDERAAAQ